MSTVTLDDTTTLDDTAAVEHRTSPDASSSAAAGDQQVLNLTDGSWHVAVPEFSGPFDLLLQLAAARKVELFEIDLAELTADFLAHVDTLDELDLATATQFVVVAATLIEMKAARLLPGEDDDELSAELAEARDLLYARLMEFDAFRRTAVAMREPLHDGLALRTRDAVTPPELRRLQPPMEEITLDATDLARMAALAQRDHRKRQNAEVGLTHLRLTGMRTRDAVIRLLEFVPVVGDTSDWTRVVRRRNRNERVVLFLALLELYKTGAIDVSHAADGSRQVSRRLRDVDAALVLADASEVTPGQTVPVVPQPTAPVADEQTDADVAPLRVAG